MIKKLPQNFFGRLCRAITEFDMINDGDKILIGLSGGKDSLFLTYALSVLQQYSPRTFEIAAFTLDPLFTTDFDTAELKAWCGELGISFHTDQVNIAEIIANQNGKDPCFTCSYFRRAVLNRFAVTHGFNKIAYAHHHDDAVETFFMGLLYSGQIKTFLPTTYLDRTGLTVIRPLIYFREDELRGTHALHGFTPIPSPCPLDGKTKRQEIKEMIADLGKTNPALYAHLAAGMRTNPATELWPTELTREQLRDKHIDFWKK